MPDVRVGVVNAPAISDELTTGLVDDIREELEARFPDVSWASSSSTTVWWSRRRKTARSSAQLGSSSWRARGTSSSS